MYVHVCGRHWHFCVHCTELHGCEKVHKCTIDTVGNVRNLCVRSSRVIIVRRKRLITLWVVILCIVCDSTFYDYRAWYYHAKRAFKIALYIIQQIRNLSICLFSHNYLLWYPRYKILQLYLSQNMKEN